MQTSEPSLSGAELVRGDAQCGVSSGRFPADKTEPPPSIAQNGSVLAGPDLWAGTRSPGLWDVEQAQDARTAGSSLYDTPTCQETGNERGACGFARTCELSSDYVDLIARGHSWRNRGGQRWPWLQRAGAMPSRRAASP